MRFMVVERFAPEKAHAISERFRRDGRLLPDNVTYVASWMTLDGGKCFQIMEAPDERALGVWLDRWADLVDFEVSPILTSDEYWAAKR